MEMFRLVALTDGAPPNKVTDKAVCAAVVERSTQPVESLLCPFMPSLMCVTQQLWPEAGAFRNEGTTIV